MVVICRNCGHKARITLPSRAEGREQKPQSGVMLFEQASSWNGSLGVKMVTPDIVHLMVKPLYQTIALTLPITVGAIVATQRYHLDPLLTPLLFCVSFGSLMTRFARFLTWNEPQRQQPDADIEEDEPEEELAPEISTQALAWQDIQKTQGGVKLRALIVPYVNAPGRHVPVKLVQRFAIAVVNNGMEWVDERDLEGIGRTVYRSIREAWLECGYAVRTADRKTVLTEHGRNMTRKVAMTPPE